LKLFIDAIPLFGEAPGLSGGKRRVTGWRTVVRPFRSRARMKFRTGMPGKRFFFVKKKQKTFVLNGLRLG
jgi:hypothetical protein